MKDPAFLFYSNNFYEGTRTMLPEERACYVDLMIYQHQHGFIPNDIRRVALYCNGISEATLEAVLEAKFELTECGWINKTLDRVINDRKEYTTSQSQKGVVGQFWKKSKAILDSVDYLKLRDLFGSKSVNEMFELINGVVVSEATLKAMLEAKLKHYINTNTITIINKDKIINKGKEEEEESYSEITEQGMSLPVKKQLSEIVQLSPYAYQSDLSLDACKAELLKSQLWLEQVTMNKQLKSVRDTEVWLIQFFSTLAADGITQKGVSDAKKHFNRWLALQIQNKTSTNANNKSNTSRQDETIAGFSSRLEERNNAFLAREQQESN